MTAAETAAAAGRPVIRAARLPGGVRAILETLARHGPGAVLVGGCVRDLARGAAVHDFDIASAAPPERVLELFSRAVPVGLRFGTVMVPTPEGPVDVTTFRGASLEDDLARRDLTVNAMAWDPRSEAVVDPFGGLADLRAGVLRPVGSARARFAEDPLRAIRAARLAAQLGFRVHPSIGPAMAEAREALRGVARERIRRELEALLVAPGAGAALRLLRGAGIEEDLAPGTRADAPPVVDALPRRLLWRLAAWLRGTDAEAVLRRLRFPRAVSAQVGRLVRVHPVDGDAEPARLASVRRLVRRAGDENLEALFALREAELQTASADAADRARLGALRLAVARLRREGALALRRRDLALDGEAVMRILGCGPGRRVGQALEYLTERVLDDPDCNTPEALRALLERWRA